MYNDRWIVYDDEYEYDVAEDDDVYGDADDDTDVVDNDRDRICVNALMRWPQFVVLTSLANICLHTFFVLNVLFEIVYTMLSCAGAVFMA